LIKIIPALIAWIATWHFNFSFADETPSTATWGNDYTHWEFKYSIEGVDLRVYPIDSGKTTTVTTIEDGGTITMTENEDMKKYIREEPERIIPLNPEDLEINPEYKRGTLVDYNTLFIDLNLNLTKDYLESILSDEISNTTNEKSYIVDVVVKYKLKEYPTNFQYFFGVNFLRLIGGIFTESSNMEVNINNTISQVINVATISKEDSDSEALVKYDTELNDDNDLFSSIISYLILSEEDFEGISLIDLRLIWWFDENNYNEEYVDSSKVQLFMFYTIDNFDDLKNILELEYEDDDEWDTWWDDNWWDDNWWDDNWWDENWWDDNNWNENWWDDNNWNENWWDDNNWNENWWDDNNWNENWWDDNNWNENWWDDNNWNENWWNIEELTCSSNNLLITYPISWEYLKLQDTKVQWHLSGSTCSGEVFTIKLYWWTNKWNITLWTVSANSWEFSNLSGFNNTWLLETKFAIYLWDSEDDLEPLKDSPTFYLDDEKPEISSASYKFTPERTSIFGLNDKVDIIFTWSEELTWITVNVLWRNATFVSKSDLKYTYSIQLSTGNNTWQFLYNISFRDLAGNTWYYEYYNSWLVTDTTLPEISGLEFRRISDKTWFVSFSLTKTWKVTFYYVLSWWKATETLTESNIKSFSTNLGRARTDKSWYIYKYTITLEDLAGNKNYYAGTFQLSWDTISYNVVTASWSTIKTWTAVSMISILSDELSVFSWCKAKTGMNYTLIQYNVRVNGKTNIVKVQMPKFNDASIQSSAETVSKLLVDWLQWSTISWLNQSKLNVFAWELNDYFVLVKMKRDPEICNANLSILPSLYMTRLLNTLKKYKIIK